MSSNPKKSCTKDDCPNDPKSKKTEGPCKEEKKTEIDLCNDPGCSNMHEKKLVDMRQGLNQLENILKVMTGLCKEPKCPVNAPDAPKIEAPPVLPIPNRYVTEKVPQKEVCITEDTKVCKGSVCYNKYMGYNIEPMVKDDKLCGSKSCLPGQGPKPKLPCTRAVCPFGNKKEQRTESPKSGMGPCGGFSCPYPNDPFSPPAFKSKLLDMPTNNLFPDLKPTYLPPTGISSGLTSGFGTSATNKFSACDACGSDKTPVGLCGRSSCPYASVEFAQKLEEIKNQFCGSPDCPFSALKSKYCGDASCPEKPKTCVDPLCPFAPPKETTCGSPTCPYSKEKDVKQSSGEKIGLCGRSDCPFASMDQSYQQSGTCGSPECGMASKTSPGSLKPCPYADQTKRYPCGSPSCPYLNPSGLVQTHEYTNDKSYVQEASRPYCGSACPFDYMSSIKPSYPSPYATNFPLFSYTEPPKIPPCPYMPKSPRKPCGMPNCPYADKNKQKDNFCIDQTCPYGEGICGGPRKFSCDNPEVRPCESPDCKLPKPKKSKESKTCCHCGGPLSTQDDSFNDNDSGICGSPKKFSCESPNVEYCRSPDCPVHRKPKERKKRKGTCCQIQDPDPDEGVCRKKKKKKHTCGCQGGSSLQDDDVGICGGPKKFSCESPLVIHCRTQECKVPPPRDDDWCGKPTCRPKMESGDSTSDLEGICGGPKKLSCENPEVENCRSPTCPVHGKKKKDKHSKRCRMAQRTEEGPCGSPLSCDNPEVIPCLGPECKVTISGSGDRDKCGTKTCPYLKKLIFCDDCGGVLPDDETSTMSSSDDLDTPSPTEDTSTPVDQEIKKEVQIVPKKDYLAQQFDDTKPKLTKAVPLYEYPGVQIGHRECSYRNKRVPRNMGWLWNRIPCFGNPELWRGYKPGSIVKSVYKIIKKHRKEIDLVEGKKKRSRSRMRIMDLKHCIEVKKKEGEYHITVNPVKDPKTRNPMDNPYMDVTPIQYKIGKEEKPRDPNYCPCDEDGNEIKSEASTEFDFHFTPPAAIPDIFAKKKKNRKEVEIQYNIMDLPPELRGSHKGSGQKGKGKKKGKKKK